MCVRYPQWLYCTAAWCMWSPGVQRKRCRCVQLSVVGASWSHPDSGGGWWTRSGYVWWFYSVYSVLLPFCIVTAASCLMLCLCRCSSGESSQCGFSSHHKHRAWDSSVCHCSGVWSTESISLTLLCCDVTKITELLCNRPTEPSSWTTGS